MSARDWLRAEIAADLAEHGASHVEADDPEFSALLRAALSESGVSDRATALLMEVEAVPTAVDLESATGIPLAKDPGIAQRREALGITTAQAAAELGLGAAAAYERLERNPLQWRNVRADVLAVYLGALGVSTGPFLRWIASLLPGHRQFAWGYRPGATVDRPFEVVGSPDDHEAFMSWGRQLLDTKLQMQTDHDVRELLGIRWSQSATHARAAQIAAAARARVLRLPMHPWGGAPTGLVALPTPTGLQYPAFQFDETGAPRAVVVEINGWLRAESDPWGVADWWVNSNPRLGVAPATLVSGDHSDLDRIRAAARALLEDD